MHFTCTLLTSFFLTLPDLRLTHFLTLILFYFFSDLSLVLILVLFPSFFFVILPCFACFFFFGMFSRPSSSRCSSQEEEVDILQTFSQLNKPSSSSDLFFGKARPQPLTSNKHPRRGSKGAVDQGYIVFGKRLTRVLRQIHYKEFLHDDFYLLQQKQMSKSFSRNKTRLDKVIIERI